MDMPTEPKVCTRCKAEKPASEFHFKDRQTGRRFTWCKACHNVRQPPREPKPVLSVKTCSRCYMELAIDQFRPMRTYCKRCGMQSADRAQVAVAQRRYRDAHRGELQDRAKQRYETDPRYGAEKQKAWRAKNPDKSRATVKRYRVNTPDMNRISIANRRARLCGAVGSLKLEDWLAVRAYCANTCIKCHRSEPEIELTMDHVIPLSRGGPNVIENIQPLCRGCNARKYADADDWRREYAEFVEEQQE